MPEAKPALPLRSKGVASRLEPPAIPPAVPTATKPSLPTQPARIVSSKPILPPRVSLHANGPALPSRNKTVTVIKAQASCGRKRPPKYQHRNFQCVDAYVRTLPDYATLSDLAYALTCHFSDPVEKYRAIFCWIAFNVAYDAESFLKNRVPPQSAGETFRTKKAVCAGYSKLFQQLCDDAKLHSIEINGYGKGFGFNPNEVLLKSSNHAWNAVYVEDEWRMVDNTWGAGVLAQEFTFVFDDFFFLADPEEFIYQHMPMQDDHQFTSSRFTWEQFFAMNNLKGLFFKHEIQLLNHIDCGNLLRPTQGQEVTVLLSVPRHLRLLVKCQIGGHPAPGFLNWEVDGRPGFLKAVCTVRVNNHNTATLDIFSTDSVSQTETQYEQLMSFQLLIAPSYEEGARSLPDFPRLFNLETGVSIVSPLVVPLRVSTSHHFVLKDLTSDAQAKMRRLVLWQDGPKAQFERKVVSGCLVYDVHYQVRSAAELLIMEEQNSGRYSSLVSYPVLIK